ncbi:MAG: hypothetical protein RBU23_00420 [Candidatus Auribacterota bacterium]|jgi:hypothetical protein|nr:hypothetical protein [Candidatus Auribacterota bacterium]
MLKKISLFFLISAFFLLQEGFAENPPEPAGKSIYIPPQEDRHTALFDFEAVIQPQSPAPLVFLIDDCAPSARIASAVNHLRTYIHLWAPDSSYRYGRHILYTRESSPDYQSWDIERYAVAWSDSQDNALEELYQSLQLKKDFIKAPVTELDAILSNWAKNEYSYNYDRFLRLMQKARQASIPSEQFLFALFALMDTAQLPPDPYPILNIYRKAYLQTYITNGTAPYSFERIEREQDAFHARLMELSAKLNHEDIDFLLEAVVARRMVFADYKRFMKLMDSVGIDCIDEYPAFHFRLYTTAWHDKLKAPQVQAELRQAIEELQKSFQPAYKRILPENWNEYKETLMRFVHGSITIDQYRLINMTPRFIQSGPMDETTKDVMARITKLWTDPVQKKVAEAVRTFFRYIQLYEDQFNAIRKTMEDTGADVVFITANSKDLPAWIFWFSSIETGGVIYVNPKIPKPEGDNNYFRLMRGERSPFEKLLEEFGGNQ